MSIIYSHVPGSFWRRVWCNIWYGWGHTRFTVLPGRAVQCACGWRGRIEDDGDDD